MEGKESTTAYAMSWLNAFPDARITIHDEIRPGRLDRAAVHVRGYARGHARHACGRDRADARRLTGRGAQRLRIEGDVLAETHLYSTRFR